MPERAGLIVEVMGLGTEWETVKLSDVCDIHYGKDHKKLNDGNIPCYGSGGIMRYVDTAIYNDESVLIPRKGTLSNVFFAEVPFWTVDTLFWTDIKKKKVVPRYLYYKLLRLNLAGMNVGTAVPSLTTALLSEIQFPLPPLPTQKRIAAILSALDDKIELNNRMNKNLEEQAQAIFKSWFVDFEPWGGVMPEGWREVPLGSLVQSIDNRGKTPPLAVRSTEYPIIDVKALSGSQRVIDFNNCTKYVEAETYHSWFRSGHPRPYDILLSTVGSLAEMKLFFGTRGCVAQNVVGFRAKTPLFLYQYLQYIKDDLVSYNIGSVQPSIKVSHIIKHPIIVPTDDILRKFDNFVEPLTNVIYTNHCQREHLASIRDTLLPRLMSGELSVSEIEP